MISHGLVEPFDIDDGELQNFAPQMCFALGVEWQMFRERLAEGKAFTELFLAPNATRLTKMAERAQRFVEARPELEGWVLITVGDHVV
jgi:hypothetical protein